MQYFLHAIRNYVNFSGRARRKEFWMFVLFAFLFSVAAGIIDNTLGTVDSTGSAGLVGGLFALFLLLPSLAVTARRLHDTGKSALWMLLYFIPAVGFLVILIFCLLPGNEGPNRYGPDPKQAGPVSSDDILDSGL